MASETGKFLLLVWFGYILCFFSKLLLSPEVFMLYVSSVQHTARFVPDSAPSGQNGTQI